MLISVSLCVADFHVHKKLTDFHVHKKQTIDIRRQNQKGSHIIFFIFWKTIQWCMFVAILSFTACLYQILEGVGGGGRILNSIM